MGNRLQGHNYGYTGARKNLPEKTCQKKPARKNPFGEKTWQEIWVGTMAQTQSSWQPILRGFTAKENMFSN